MHLVIVESPNKCAKIQGILGPEYVVAASFGHVRDLPETNGLGMELDHGSRQVRPRYRVKARAKKALGRLRTLAEKASSVILATDPDREGEAIAWHLVSALKLKRGTYVRSVFHAITSPAVKDGIANPRSIAQDLVDAQQARRCVDRCVGWMVSAVCRVGIRDAAVATAGRVQSPAVRLVVERDAAIAAFNPITYQEVVATLRSPKATSAWPATLVTWDGRQIVRPREQTGDEEEGEAKPAENQANGLSLADPQLAADIARRCQAATWQVQSVIGRDSVRKPHPPFTTSTLQQAASVELGMSPSLTMSCAQRLFEHGLISYHRTDSPTISPEGVAELRGFIATAYPDCLPEKPQSFAAGTVNAQEAHEAIRPTHVEQREANLGGDSEESALSGKLYDLIWRRAVASQMKDGLDRVQTALFAADRGTFRADGVTRITDGWRRLLVEQRRDAHEEEAAVIVLPPLAQGDSVGCEKVAAIGKATRPPRRYTEASLVRDLERRGIGRPATFASIMETIRTRHYVALNGRFLSATPAGCALVRFLTTHYAGDFIDYAYTAQVERSLDQVAQGGKPWGEVVTAAVASLSAKTTAAGYGEVIAPLLAADDGDDEADGEHVSATAPTVAIPSDAIKRECRDCGAAIVLFKQDERWVVAEVDPANPASGQRHQCKPSVGARKAAPGPASAPTSAPRVAVPSDAIKRECRDCGAAIVLFKQDERWVVAEVDPANPASGQRHQCKPSAGARKAAPGPASAPTSAPTSAPRVAVPSDAIKRECRDCGAAIVLFKQDERWVVAEVDPANPASGQRHQCKRRRA